uniref:Uncharacterized protein n=1 Tax=Anguilla anguilla TaxID=7936 RepID=A0A0E9XTN7_ANGAN
MTYYIINVKGTYKLPEEKVALYTV